MADSGHLEKLKVAELRKLCKEKDLKSTGNKGELLARLQGAVSDTEGGIPEDDHDDEMDALPDDDDDLAEDALLNDDDDKLETDGAKEVLESEKAILDEKKPAPEAPPKAKSPEVPKSPETTKKISLKKIEFSSTPAAPEEKKDPMKILTKEEIAAARAARFGTQSEENKKEDRLKRFGTESSAPANGTNKKTLTIANVKAAAKQQKTPEELEKLKKRAERFGTVVSTSLSKVTEQEKVLKRKERFGAVTGGSKVVGTGSEEEMKKRRLERFGGPV